MEKMDTLKTNYYLADDDIDILLEAFSIVNRLTDNGCHGTNEYYYTSDDNNTGITLSGEELGACQYALDILTGFLEDSCHISKVKIK